MNKVAGTFRVPSAIKSRPRASSQPVTPSGGRHTARACYRRCGAALIVVLAGLSLAAVTFLAVTRMILIQHKTIELSARQIQAAWLAESGVQRAAARLAANATYRGETWKLSAADLGGGQRAPVDDASVTIRVEPVPGKPDRRAVSVQADFPSDPVLRAREKRAVELRVNH